ncbi:hypothetical protein [Pseudoalteromonas sp. PPB1]|uniref:hypothetical protein n=1 Tax=Pseudoalteromonas sp. PPB1 TaxID=2756136 RepID=UPI0018911113|nr:hypothetical protein [Pseudoalteromonas sp. PPB1]
MTLMALKVSHLEPYALDIDSQIFSLAYMDVGALAIAGRGSGVIDSIFSLQNRTLK